MDRTPGEQPEARGISALTSKIMAQGALGFYNVKITIFGIGATVMKWQLFLSLHLNTHMYKESTVAKSTWIPF